MALLIQYLKPLFQFYTSRSIMGKLSITFTVLTIVFTLSGILSVTQLRSVYQSGFDLGAKSAPLVNACMEIKLNAVNAHLLFEEIISGDDSEDINEVWSLLDKSKWYANAILNGQTLEHSTIYPTDNEVVRKKMQGVLKDLDSFIEAAKLRLKEHKGTKAGSQDDQDFDSYYEKIQLALDEISKTNSTQAGNSNYVKYLLANAHLFFEELLSGDDENKIEDITNQMVQANTIIQQKLPQHQSTISPMIDQLISLTEIRYKNNNSNASTGSASDENFDQLFEKLMENVSDVEKITEIVMAQKLEHMTEVRDQSTTISISLTILFVIFAILVAWYTASSFSKVIRVVKENIIDISSGILNKKIDTSYTEIYQDEFSELLNASELMQSNLSKLISQLNQNSKTLLITSDKQSHISSEISQSADSMKTSSIEINSNTEMTSNNLNDAVASSDVMGQSFLTVSAALEELSITVNDIAANCQRESEMTRSAAEQTQETNQLVNQLNTSANEIDKIIDLINNIASQTNLLALNATIEAASAGDAGKGFAVVANEVKALAKQTSDATQEISKQIENMKDKTSQAVNAIVGITALIQEVSQVSLSIANAVEEQSITYNEVSKSMSSVKQTSEVVNQKVIASANELKTIAQHSNQFNQNILIFAQKISEINQGTLELTKLSSSLEGSVNEFKI